MFSKVDSPEKKQLWTYNKKTKHAKSGVCSTRINLRKGLFLIDIGVEITWTRDVRMESSDPPNPSICATTAFGANLGVGVWGLSHGMYSNNAPRKSTPQKSSIYCRLLLIETIS